MTLEDIYETYKSKLSAVKSEYKKAIEDFLTEKGLSEDVYNRNGKRGRLLVEKTFGGEGYEIKFFAYTKSGELSKVSSGYIWVWSSNGLDDFRRADDADSN